MKIRTGFVSNSSSSSFVCDLCGYADSAYDGSPCDVGMIECINGHCICEDHVLPLPTDLAKLFGDDDEYIEHPSDDTVFFNNEGHTEDGELIAECCPICTLSRIPHSELLVFMMDHFQTDTKQMMELIRNTYPTHKDFAAFVTSARNQRKLHETVFTRG